MLVRIVATLAIVGLSVSCNQGQQNQPQQVPLQNQGQVQGVFPNNPAPQQPILPPQPQQPIFDPNVPLTFFQYDMLAAQNCGGAGCHGAGTNLAYMVGNEMLARDFSADIITFIQDPNNPMPQSGLLDQNTINMMLSYLNNIQL